MASWETGTQEASVATLSEINSFRGERSSTRTAGDGYGLAEKIIDTVRGEYSVVGINANKVPAMRQAIRDYVTVIQTHLDDIQTQINADNAFRGEELQTAVQAYLNKVKDYCMALVSYLLTFSDKLKDVEEAWARYVTTTSGDINAAAGALGSTQAYTEKK